MACFQSLAARRFLLWYILVVSFVVLPLTWDITMGCRLILGGEDEMSRKALSGYGLFRVAVYDTDHSFLGCVAYPDVMDISPNSGGFKIGRTFGVLAATFVTLATTLCLLIQCFNKHGKTWLWQIMKWCFVIGFVSQCLVFFMSSDLCGSEEVPQCALGPNGIATVFNLVFLFGMIVATFNSLPPRNPVFRCWNAAPTEYDTDHIDTDDEFTTNIHDAENPKLDDSDDEHDFDKGNRARSSNESVSLFGSSQSQSSRRQRSVRSGKSNRSERHRGTTTRKASFEPSIAEEEEYHQETPRTTNHETQMRREDPPSSGSYYQRQKSVFTAFENKSTRTEKTEETADDNSTLPSKLSSGGSNKKGTPSVRSQSTAGKKSMKSSASARSKQTSVLTDDASARSGSSRSNKRGGSAKSSASDTESEVSVLSRLGASVKLGEGGVRISETRIGQKLQIVDQYPPDANSVGGEIDTDIVKVRTEYCPDGRKTIREETHDDGTRSVTTMIDPTSVDL